MVDCPVVKRLILFHWLLHIYCLITQKLERTEGSESRFKLGEKR